jgi:hypothetical protein
MSLGQSEEMREAPGSAGAEPASEERQAATEASWALAEDAVPMRGAAERELDRYSEERVRSVLEKPRWRFRPPSVRNLGLALAGLAALIICLAVLGSLGEDGSGGPEPTAAPTRQSPLASRAARRASAAASLWQARAARNRRRAAARAKHEAARHRAKQRSAGKRAASGAQEQQAAAPSEPSTESAAPAAAPITAATPQEPASTTASGSPSQAQRQFGFER